jgi:hypothetical protein
LSEHPDKSNNMSAAAATNAERLSLDGLTMEGRGL